ILDGPVARQKMIGLKLHDGVDGRGPLSRIAVCDVRKKANDRVTGGDGALLWTEYLHIAGGVSPPMKLYVEIVCAVLNHVRLCEGDVRQLGRKAFHLHLIRLG